MKPYFVKLSSMLKQIAPDDNTFSDCEDLKVLEARLHEELGFYATLQVTVPVDACSILKDAPCVTFGKHISGRAHVFFQGQFYCVVERDERTAVLEFRGTCAKRHQSLDKIKKERPEISSEPELIYIPPVIGDVEVVSLDQGVPQRDVNYFPDRLTIKHVEPVREWKINIQATWVCQESATLDLTHRIQHLLPGGGIRTYSGTLLKTQWRRGYSTNIQENFVIRANDLQLADRLPKVVVLDADGVTLTQEVYRPSMQVTYHQEVKVQEQLAMTLEMPSQFVSDLPGRAREININLGTIYGHTAIPLWAADVYYEAGERVLDAGGQCWRATVSHRSGAAFPSDQVYWVRDLEGRVFDGDGPHHGQSFFQTPTGKRALGSVFNTCRKRLLAGARRAILKMQVPLTSAIRLSLRDGVLLTGNEIPAEMRGACAKVHRKDIHICGKTGATLCTLTLMDYARSEIDALFRDISARVQEAVARQVDQHQGDLRPLTSENFLREVRVVNDAAQQEEVLAALDNARFSDLLPLQTQLHLVCENLKRPRTARRRYDVVLAHQQHDFTSASSLLPMGD